MTKDTVKSKVSLKRLQNQTKYRKTYTKYQ